MKRMIVLCLAALLLVGTTAPANAAWADRFPGPEISGPGANKAPGVIVDTLTPELKYKLVGSLSYIYIFDGEKSLATLDEQFSKRPKPVLLCQVHSTSFRIPAGVLAPGHSYYWYVQSIHAPGTRSEAVKNSAVLYFSTAKDGKQLILNRQKP